jgi:hypothetical protein
MDRSGEIHNLRAGLHLPEEAFAGRGRGLSRGQRGRSHQAQGDTDDSTYPCASVVHVQDYRLILLSPSLGQPLFANRTHLRAAGPTVASPKQADNDQEHNAETDQDCEI